MRRGLPLADARAFREAAARTRLQRTLVAAAVAALAFATVALARDPDLRSERFLPAASNGIVILDVSASISPDTHRRIRATLLRLAATGGRYGLVVFSDVAYEALPPGTPAAELRPIARYFEGRPSDPNPWLIAFSGGTRISAGLDLADEIVERDRLPRSAVLLVSDLDDDTADVALLRRSLAALESRGIVVRVVGLNPAPEDERLFRRLLTEPDAVGRATLAGPPGGAQALFPWALVATAVLLAAALAGFELWRARLRWAG